MPFLGHVVFSSPLRRLYIRLQTMQRRMPGQFHGLVDRPRMLVHSEILFIHLNIVVFSFKELNYVYAIENESDAVRVDITDNRVTV